MKLVEVEKITATYATNYNIHNIDKRIKQMFEKEREMIGKLEEEKKRLEWIKDNSDDMVEIDLAKRALKEVMNQRQDIITGKKQNEYKEKTQEILDLYDMALPPTGGKVFGMKDDKQPDPNVEIRLKLIARYLQIAKKYYPLNITRTEIADSKCPNCGEKLDDKLIGLCCSNPKCGYFQEAVETMCSHKEFQQTNSKFPYSKKENFAEGMRNFQGKQPKRPPERVFDIVRQEMAKYNIDKTQLTKHALHQILRTKHLSENYSDLNLIYSIITETPPPDISHYESALLHRYDLFEEIYEDIKPEDRQNSLHIQYLLWAFLTQEGYRCDPDDFLTLKTREVLLEHDQVMRRACRILKSRYPHMNWTFTPRA